MKYDIAMRVEHFLSIALVILALSAPARAQVPSFPFGCAQGFGW